MSDNYESQETPDLLRDWCEQVGEVEAGTHRWRFWRPDGGGAVQCEDFDGWRGFGVIVDEMRRRGFDGSLDWGKYIEPPWFYVGFWKAPLTAPPETHDDPDPARAAVIAALRALAAEKQVGASAPVHCRDEGCDECYGN